MCDTVPLREMTESSSRCLSQNIQYHLSILDIVVGTKEACNNGFQFYFSSRHQSYTRRSEMKIIIAAVISVALLIGAPVFLMEKQQAAFAISDYQSGYNHGCNDVNKPVSQRYINAIGKGESQHTAEFMNGYHQGFKACAGPDDQDTSDFPELNVGQHYGECEERSVGLTCDILNDTNRVK